MSGHTQIGCPVARLEMMVLVINSYVVVCVVYKRRRLSLYWVLFLNLCIATPVFLTDIVYQESNVIQRMTPRTNISLQESYQSILSRRIGTIVPLTPLLQQNYPTDIIVAVGSYHINCFNPIKLYLSIKYNRIINNIILFPNIPKYPISDHNISK